jgi:hypothetical protein
MVSFITALPHCDKQSRCIDFRRWGRQLPEITVESRDGTSPIFPKLAAFPALDPAMLQALYVRSPFGAPVP